MSLDLDRSSWRRVKFGDVVRQCKESTDPEVDGVERYVAGEHMDTDNLKISRWGEVGDGYLGPAFHRKFKSGHVLYGSRRTYLRKVALADFDGVCANTTFVMESADPAVLLPELLPFIMSTETFHTHSIAESKGSVNPYVNWPDIAKYEFDLPPLADQRRLAELLWAVERARQSLADLTQQLHSTTLARVQHWSAKQAEFTTLKSIARMYQPKTIPKTDLVAGGAYRVYGANGPIGRYDEYNRDGLTIAVACRGATCGEVNVIREKAWVTGNAMVVEAKAEEDGEYLASLLPYVDFGRATSGSAQPQITRSSLEPISVPWPPQMERDTFVKAIDCSRTVLDSVANECESLLNVRLSVLRRIEGPQ